MTNLIHNITTLEDAHTMKIFADRKMQGEKGVEVTKHFDLDVKKGKQIWRMLHPSSSGLLSK